MHQGFSQRGGGLPRRASQDQHCRRPDAHLPGQLRAWQALLPLHPVRPISHGAHPESRWGKRNRPPGSRWGMEGSHRKGPWDGNERNGHLWRM